MANSIGSLYIDIVARTDSLAADMAKVKAQVTGLQNGFNGAGDGAEAMGKKIGVALGTTALEKFTARFLLYQLFHAVTREINNVIENIDRIPGLPAMAVESVHEFKVELMESRQILDGWIAQGISVAAVAANALGAGIGRLVYGNEAFEDSLKAVIPTMDQLALANDPGYWQKVDAAVRQLAEARKADGIAALFGAAKIAALRHEVELLETHSKTGGINTLDSVKDKIKAYGLEQQANSTLKEMLQQLDIAQQAVNNTTLKGTMATMSATQKVAAYKYQINDLNVALQANTDAGGGANGNDPALLQTRIALLKQLAVAQAGYNAEVGKTKSATLEMVNAFSSGMEDMSGYLTSFVTGGTAKLSDFLKKMADHIIETFIKLAIINPLMNMMFGGVSGFSAGASLWAGKAAGGPASGIHLVGEKGPELVNLPTGSTVMPAEQTAQRLGGGGRSGGTYYIDARGADEARIQGLERALSAVNATIERRAFTGNASIIDRGGPRAAALRK